MGNFKSFAELKSLLNENKNDISTLIKKVTDLTDNNDHNNSILEIAKYFKMNKYVKIIDSVIKIHMINNGMPQELIKYRTSITKEIFDLVKRKVSKEDYEKLKGSL